MFNDYMVIKLVTIEGIMSFLLRITVVIGICLLNINSTSLAAEKPKKDFSLENKIGLQNDKISTMNRDIQQESYSPPGKAFIKSLILPGWGEMAVGYKKRATLFLIAEGLLWSSFAALNIYGNWKQNDLEKYAVAHAGVNTTGKSASFYSDLSNFYDIYEYNEEKRRFRQYNEVYPMDEDHFWQWKSENNLKKFDQLRTSSEVAKRNATLVVGGIIINHVISAIDAIWVTHQSNKKLSSSIRFSPFINRFGELGYHLSFTKSF
jgi:hypothetical protein